MKQSTKQHAVYPSYPLNTCFGRALLFLQDKANPPAAPAPGPKSSSSSPKGGLTRRPHGQTHSISNFLQGPQTPHSLARQTCRLFAMNIIIGSLPYKFTYALGAASLKAVLQVCIQVAALLSQVATPTSHPMPTCKSAPNLSGWQAAVADLLFLSKLATRFWKQKEQSTLNGLTNIID